MCEDPLSKIFIIFLFIIFAFLNDFSATPDQITRISVFIIYIITRNMLK